MAAPFNFGTHLETCCGDSRAWRPLVCEHRRTHVGAVRTLVHASKRTEAYKCIVVGSFCKSSKNDAAFKIEVMSLCLCFMRHEFNPSQFHAACCVGSITSRCSGKEPALHANQTRESGGNRAYVLPGKEFVTVTCPRFKLMHPIDTPLKENVSGFYAGAHHLLVLRLSVFYSI